MVSINCTLGTSQAKHINLSSVDLCKRRNALNSGNRSMTDYTGKFLALKTSNQQNDRDKSLQCTVQCDTASSEHESNISPGRVDSRHKNIPAVGF